MDLNPQQQQAVEHGKGPLLVVAGAGSGKTRVIVHRVAHLIGKQNVHPSNILAVTFTNKAAGEMKARLEAMLGLAARDLWIATFHSTCLRILRRHFEHVGYGPNFRVYDEADQLSLIKECLGVLNIGDRLMRPKSALDHIARAKDRCVGPEEFGADNFYLQKVSEVYALYQKRLNEVGAMDFGDLIRLTVKLFESHPDVLNYYCNRFRHVLVDEYQDTNHAQYRLIELLVGLHRNICVVGDEDQSIYRWRGADITNILRFEKDFPGARVIRLEQNYRSTKTIIKAAGGVIANNAGRKPKTLWTQNPQGEPVDVVSCTTEREEAQIVADAIQRLKHEKKSYSEMAVFYRTNAQSRPFEEVFLKEGIPYRIFGWIRFYERMEIKDAIAYLRLIANPKDDISLSRIINVPSRGIGRETLLRLREFAAARSLSMFEVLKDFTVTTIVRAVTAKKLSAFHDMIETLRQGALKRPVTDILHDVLEKSGYVEALASQKTTEAQDRLENINELVAAVDEFEPQTDEPPLNQFLDQVALVSDVDAYDADAEAVTLMTVHLAKGLEFSFVFMVGMEEGLFPHARSLDDPDELEEERRLCYVGMTRAKEHLTMSYAFRRQTFGTPRYGVVSRFIDEIPDELKKVHERLEARSEKLEARSHKSNYLASSVSLLASDDSHFTNNESRLPAKVVMAGVTGHDSDFDQRPPEERIGQFAVGIRVHHPAFGRGFVKHCEPSSAGHKVTVQFESGFIKRLIAERAGLVPL